MGRKVLIIAGVVFLAIAVAAVSCKKAQEKKSGGERAAAQKMDTTEKNHNAAAEKEVVLAEVEGKPITWDDLDDIYHIERMSNRLNEEQVKRLLDNLVRERLVYLDGLEKGYDQDPEYVRQLERDKRKLVHRMVMEDLARKRPQVTEKEIKQYYDDHPEAFRVAKVQYLMFSPLKFGNDRDKAEKEAEKALEAINGGMTMEEASGKFLDRERPFTMNIREDQGSFFGRDFDRRMEELKPGEVAGPVQTPQGFIVAKLLERRTQSFKEARGHIRSLLSREKSSNRIKSYYEDLRKKYKVNVRDEALEKKLGEFKNNRPGGKGPGIVRHPPIAPGKKPLGEGESVQETGEEK